LNTQELIEKCINKDASAERALYYAYAKRIYGLCRRYTQDDHQAKDYMQESFQKIFSNLERFDEEKASFETWISKITVNTILADFNKKKVPLLFDDYNSAYGQSTRNKLGDIVAYGISNEELLAAIRKLPEDYQTVLNLFVFDNWTHEAIANHMNIEISSSRSKLTRAKQLLKKTLIHQERSNNKIAILARNF